MPGIMLGLYGRVVFVYMSEKTRGNFVMCIDYKCGLI